MKFSLEVLQDLYFSISALLYVILVFSIHSKKKKIMTLENHVFKLLIIFTFLVTIVDMSTFIVTELVFAKYLKYLYLMLLIGWLLIFSYYIFVIASEKNKGYVPLKENSEKKYFLNVAKIFLGVFVAICVGLCFFKLSGNGNNYSFVSGPAVIYTYIVGVVCVLFWGILKIKNLSNEGMNIGSIFVISIVGIVVAVIHYFFPNLVIIPAMLSLSIIILYFTLENPDIRLIEDLNMAREAADKASSTKSEFLASMSHEIRTPLNAIVGFSQTLSEEELPDESREEVNDIILSSNNLLEVVNSILDISKLEANKIEIVDTEYMFSKVIKELSTLTKIRLENKGAKIDFKVEVDPNIPPFLYGDPVRIKEILTNVLSNAVKYTDSGYIHFVVNGIIKGDICRLIVSVEDTGHGIKEEDLANLFTMYQQAEMDNESSLGGTGLGVALVKQLTELMGGKLSVRSAYGVGSKFTVALDQKIVAKSYQEIEEIKEAEVEDENTEIDVSGKRVMVVDDNGVNLKVANRLLQEYKLEIELVTSGKDCIEKIKNGEKYDLIMMDDQMPGMGGTETLENLKQIEGFNMPVIALTANSSSGIREKYVGEGFNDYLAKPIVKDQLHKVLKDYLVSSPKTTDSVPTTGELLPAEG